MEQQLEMENVKCGGCARLIEKALLADAHIKAVTVKPAEEGLRSAVAAAKSSVSCALGRLSD